MARKKEKKADSLNPKQLEIKTLKIVKEVQKKRKERKIYIPATDDAGTIECHFPPDLQLKEGGSGVQMINKTIRYYRSLWLSVL